MEPLRRTAADLARRVRVRASTTSPSRSPPPSPSSPSMVQEQDQEQEQGREKGQGAPARLVIASDVPKDRFDRTIARRFGDEGFDVVRYLRLQSRAGREGGEGGDGKEERKAFEAAVHRVEDELELEEGERWGVVAYRTAASALLLDICRASSSSSSSRAMPPKLCALVAYYPSSVPPQVSAVSSTTIFPPSLHVVVHLAGDGNPTQARDNVRLYSYPDAEVGFAERAPHGGRKDKDKYDETSARLAWSRTLACLRKGFGIDVSAAVEAVWERHLRAVFGVGFGTGDKDKDVDVDGVMATFADDNGDGEDGDGDGPSSSPYVNFVPSMIEGSGHKTLRHIYSSSILLPHRDLPSLHIRPLSRTVGTGSNTLVDELLLTFRHTHEVPWLLPRVAPTGREVRVVLVAVVTVRGSGKKIKIARVHMYWDQASVLVQVGVLEPGVVPVPGGFRMAEGEERNRL